MLLVTVVAIVSSCPSGWLPAPANARWRNKCYFSTERATGLRQCLDLCAPHGAPACLENAEETAFLLESIPAPYQPIPVTTTTAYRVPGHQGTRSS